MSLCIFFCVLMVSCWTLGDGGLKHSKSDGSPVATPIEDPIRPSLDHLEKFLRNFTNRAVKHVLPSMALILEKVNMSSTCVSSLLKYVSALKHIRVWAVKMFDASAKIPSGIFDGTVTEFGAFDQCLNILVKNRRGEEDFKGQYCSVETFPILGPRPKNLTLSFRSKAKFDDSIIEEAHILLYAFYHLRLRFGICVPSTCSADDMQNLGREVIKPLKHGLTVKRCHTSEAIQVEPIHIAVISVIGVLLLCIAIGSLIDCQNIKDGQQNDEKPRDRGLGEKMLLCFSLPQNFQKLTTHENSQEEMKPLHGIRALSMTWVILGHTYIWMNFQTLTKSSRAAEWFNDIEFEVILNGWLSVSSFIFLSGLLTTYTTLKFLDLKYGKFNAFFYVGRRFLRLFPSVLLILGCVFFLPWVATGPFWPELPGLEVEKCQHYWWSNILFINNWMSLNKMCLQHSWYLSADLQLHILSLLILIPLHRKTFVGLGMAALLSLGGMMAVGVITYVNNYEPTILLSTGNSENVHGIVDDIHVKTFTYFGPYCVGVVTGYLLLQLGQVKLGMKGKIIGWFAASLLSISSLYGTHKWNIGQFPGPLVTATYAALHRTAFVTGLAWVTFLCLTENAETISSILRFRPLILMSRITFMAYLMQGPIIWTRYGSMKERLFYSHFNMLYEYMGNLCLTLVLATVGHLLVEAPFANMERLLCTLVVKNGRNNRDGEVRHDTNNTNPISRNYPRLPA